MIPLGLTAAALAAYAGIHKKFFALGTTALIITNEEMEDITIIVRSLEDSGQLIKGVTETIENEAKEKRCTSWYVLSTLGASLLGNILVGKGVRRAGEVVNRLGKETNGAGQAF